MTVKKLIDKLKACPQDARVAVYPKDHHGVLSNVFIIDVWTDDYEDLGMIVDLVV